MPFIQDTTTVRFSDLVVNELDPSVGYARQDLNVTPSGALAMGTVVFRAKASTNTEATAYARLTGNAQLVNTNEFAIVYGDHYSFNPSFTPRTIATGQFNAVGFVGKNGALALKEYYVKQIAQAAGGSGGAGLTDAQFEVLRQLLKDQGIILELTVA